MTVLLTGLAVVVGLGLYSAFAIWVGRLLRNRAVCVACGEADCPDPFHGALDFEDVGP
jgi:hypothetical protein